MINEKTKLNPKIFDEDIERKAACDECGKKGLI